MGIAEAVQINAVFSHQGRSSLIVDATQNDRLVVHHIGHRDVHEPDAIDGVQSENVTAQGTGHAHADHVIKLTCSQEFSGLVSTDARTAGIHPPMVAAIASVNSFAGLTAAPRWQPRSAIVLPIRNSSLASVKLTQLRI